MRRKFDTVIKTDVLFTDKPQLVAQVKSQMRREEMWRERWARISVPDRALTVGTLRYAHITAPEVSVLAREARQAVGQSHAAVNRFQDSANKIRMGVRMSNAMHDYSHGHRSQPAQASNTEGSTSVGSAWVEIVGAFFEERKDVAEEFAKFKAAYLIDRGADEKSWQPLASRFAALEQQVIKMEEQLAAGQPRTIDGGPATAPPMVESSSRRQSVNEADGSACVREDRSLSFVPLIATTPASVLLTAPPPQEQSIDHGGISEEDSLPELTVVGGSVTQKIGPCPPQPSSVHSSAAAVAAMLRSTPGDTDATQARPAEGERESDSELGRGNAINNAPLPELLERLLRNQEALSRMVRGA
eukprot:COSAG02_NODE_3575_length_6538_cov_73.970648_4_plen_358_part_00